MLEIVGGWEPRNILGYQVGMLSAIRRTTTPIRFIPLVEQALRAQGLYTRPHEQRGKQAWDVISDAPMSTAFACSRFLTPWLATGDWVLFCDFADMLFLSDPAELLALADDRYALMVVKRDHAPSEAVKMDGQAQTSYARKNWSSVILWNRRHPANERLTVEMVNTLPGRSLHRFCWLQDHEIGDLPAEWNHLVSIDKADPLEAKLLHYTLGTLNLIRRDDGICANLWLRELEIIDATRGTI